MTDNFKSYKGGDEMTVKMKADGGEWGDGVRGGVEDGGHSTDGFILERWVDDFYFLNGIDDEIYDRAAFRSAFSIATTTTTANFRRDLL
jgi:hypothetical protein